MVLLPLVAAVALVRHAHASTPSANFLFIIVDDLRTQLSGAYGQSGVQTPNIQRLQEAGVTFTRAYSQVTVCSPARTALLTGMRPNRNRLWTIGPYFRETTLENGTAIVSLPQALKLAGFNATGAGKVWHPGTSSGAPGSYGLGAVGGADQPYSWSYPVPPGVDPRVLYYDCDAWSNATGASPASAGIKGGNGCVTTPNCVACLESFNATKGLSWAGANCHDSCFVDGMIGDYAVSHLAAPGPTPWSTFLGFKRPHLVWTVPQTALDLYGKNQTLAAHRLPPEGMPPSGWSYNGEIRSCDDMGPWVNNSLPGYLGLINDGKHAELRRAYYAAVTATDVQVGRVWNSLQASPARNNTWVVLTGDHGWNLGEHGNWAKVTLFENVARVPLIIVPPSGVPGFLRNAVIGPDAFVEHLDLFPTITELLGVDASLLPAGQLDGRSLVPLLRGEQPAVNFSAAFSQITRQIANGPGQCKGPSDVDSVDPSVSDPPAVSSRAAPLPPCAMGQSVRVRGFRYTAWTGFNFTSGRADWTDIRGEELYDEPDDGSGDENDFDANENVNVADDPAHAAIKATLLALLQQTMG